MFLVKFLFQIPLIVFLIEGVSAFLERDEWWVVLPITYVTLAFYDFAEYAIYDKEEKK